MNTRSILVLALVAGCTGAHRDGDLPDGGVGDGPPPPVCSGSTCDQTPPATCNGATLETFAAACVDNACSYPETDVACGVGGCCTDHCCELVPSNDVGPIASNGQIITAAGTFDTTTQCVSPTALGACSVIARSGLPDLCVCNADELTIGDLKVTGARALVLVAAHAVHVTGTLDVSADLDAPGPGAGSSQYSVLVGFDGGAGGSFGGVGGFGTNGVHPAAISGTSELVPLAGGHPGQSSGGGGGGGGGALQITAGETIDVSGMINAGGGGGGGGFESTSDAGGGGGGAGGGILLEAPAVSIAGVVVANGGGGGGAGGTFADGAVGGGGFTTTSGGGDGADGAGCPLDGHVVGGDGGFGASSMNDAGGGESGQTISGCLGPLDFVGGGGGGGGVGRVRINALTGCQCGGTVSPAASFGTMGTK